jgi:hypothetical protein
VKLAVSVTVSTIIKPNKISPNRLAGSRWRSVKTAHSFCRSLTRHFALESAPDAASKSQG